jgi:hypothetical protein
MIIEYRKLQLTLCCTKISLRTGRSPLELDLDSRQKNAYHGH